MRLTSPTFKRASLSGTRREIAALLNYAAVQTNEEGSLNASYDRQEYMGLLNELRNADKEMEE